MEALAVEAVGAAPANAPAGTAAAPVPAAMPVGDAESFASIGDKREHGRSMGGAWRWHILCHVSWEQVVVTDVMVLTWWLWGVVVQAARP